jgi:hypothetical protein
VIYRPETERQSHYSACSLPEQFDAYLWFDESAVVTPLADPPRGGEDETWPIGLRRSAGPAVPLHAGGVGQRVSASRPLSVRP